jgi:hypothetical protein
MSELFLACAGLREAVAREEICDLRLPIHLVFYHVSPDYFFFGQQVVDDLVLVEFVMNFVLLALQLVEFEHLGNILLLHRAHCSLYFDRSSIRQSPSLFKLREGQIVRFVCVFDVQQFLAIDEAIHVVAGHERRGHCVAWCIVRLRESVNSLPPHHFLNNHLSHSLRSHLPMDSEEIHFSNFERVAINYNFFGSAHQSSQDFVVLFIPHQNMQILQIARGSTSPPEFFFGVEQPEISNLVLNIVVHQELAHLINLSIVFYIKSVPFEARR